METIAVIDFETTGLSSNMGDRATEIAIVLVRNGSILDSFSSLMNAGVRISPSIENYTGISNEMIRSAPPASVVMRRAADFAGDYPLVAHNASFDQRFWDYELGRVRRERSAAFACSMLVSRRLYPYAPNHRLGTLATLNSIQVTGKYHRALSDAQVTAELVIKIQQDIQQKYSANYVSHEMLRIIQKAPKEQVARHIQRFLKMRA